MMPKEKQNGFTLIEIGVVIFAIAVLMSFIVPKLIGFKNAATLEASMESMRNWAKVAQSTGMNIAQYRPCDEENCTFEKWVDDDVCNPVTAGGGMTIPGGVGHGGGGGGADEHVYTDEADGACIYNLQSKTHRNALADANAGLPGLDKYTNQQRGGPIYLVHQAHTVRAFTCVDQVFVEDKTFVNYADINSDPVYEQADCDANLHYALYHSMPAMTASFAKAVARRIAMEGGGGGGGDDDDDDSSSGGSSGIGPTD
jgi:prepilin-type N-terminal cleavage/methylation domain-containing protein